MEEPKPGTKVAFGILGTLALICGFVATLLGAAAWVLSHQRTGTEGLAVIAAVFFQWVAALVGATSWACQRCVSAAGLRVSASFLASLAWCSPR